MAKYRGLVTKYCELEKEAKYWGVGAKYCASLGVHNVLTACVSGGIGGIGGHVTMQEGGHPHWRPPNCVP